MNTRNNSHCRNGGVVELADTHVLGTCLARGEGSSPFTPTIKKTSEVTILDDKFVAQDVAFDKKCCNKKMESEVGVVTGTLGSLRIEPHFTLTFITAYCSSIATSFN